MRQNSRARRVPRATDQPNPARSPDAPARHAALLPMHARARSRGRRTCEVGKRDGDDGVGKDVHDRRCRHSFESCAPGHRFLSEMVWKRRGEGCEDEPDGCRPNEIVAKKRHLGALRADRPTPSGPHTTQPSQQPSPAAVQFPTEQPAQTNLRGGEARRPRWRGERCTWLTSEVLEKAFENANLKS